MSDFYEFGFLKLPSAVSSSLVTEAVRLVNYWQSENYMSKRHLLTSHEKMGGALTTPFHDIEFDPDLLALFYDSQLPLIVRALLGTQSYELCGRHHQEGGVHSHRGHGHGLQSQSASVALTRPVMGNERHTRADALLGGDR